MECEFEGQNKNQHDSLIQKSTFWVLDNQISFPGKYSSEHKHKNAIWN